MSVNNHSTQEYFQSGRLVDGSAFSVGNFLFETFVNHSPNFCWVMNAEQQILFANASLLSYLDIRPADLPRPAIGLLPEALYEMVRLQFDPTKKAVPQGVKVRTLSINGSEKVFQLCHVPLKSLGMPSLFAGIAFDISQQDRLEKALLACNERWIAFTHKGFLGVWEMELATGKVHCNEALREMIGFFQQKTCTLKDFFRSVAPGERLRVRRSLEAFLQGTEESWEEQYHLRTHDGVTREVLNRALRVRVGKKAQRMVGSILELTNVNTLETEISLERKRVEQEWASLMMRLQEEERIRIGHELHDNVAQLLTTSKLLLDLLEPSAEQQAIKKRCKKRLLEAIDEVRGLSKTLSLPLLRHGGMLPAIKDLIQDLEMSTSLQFALSNQVPDIEELEESLKITLVRIMQEQCKNIIRHARARKVIIALQQGNGLLNLQITDDGVGFNPSKVRRGVGLFSLFERVRVLGGNMKLDSAPGKGTRLLAVFPVREAG